MPPLHPVQSACKKSETGDCVAPSPLNPHAAPPYKWWMSFGTRRRRSPQPTLRRQRSLPSDSRAPACVRQPYRYRRTPRPDSKSCRCMPSPSRKHSLCVRCHCCYTSLSSAQAHRGTELFSVPSPIPPPPSASPEFYRSAFWRCQWF